MMASCTSLRPPPISPLIFQGAWTLNSITPGRFGKENHAGEVVPASVPQKIEHDFSSSWNVHPAWPTITMHHSVHLPGPQLMVVQFNIVYQLPTCSHHIT